jgi:ribosomal protein S18 acetylase RimI-like enzyme
MSPKIVLRKIEPADVSQVAQVHISSFPASTLTKLGRRVVEQYYRWQLVGPHPKTWAIGAYSGDTCIGFLFGGIYNDSASGFVSINKWLLMKEIFRRPWLLTYSGIYTKIRQSFKMLRHHRRNLRNPGSQVIKACHGENPSFGILSVGVSAASQKLGIGQQLMRQAEEEALRCGFSQMDLTVHPGNSKAVAFYEKLYWQKVLSGDQWQGVMIKKLNDKKIVSSAEPKRETVAI